MDKEKPKVANGEGESKRQVWSLRAKGTGEQGEVGGKGRLGKSRRGRLLTAKCFNGLELLLSLLAVHHCYHCPLKF